MLIKLLQKIRRGYIPYVIQNVNNSLFKASAQAEQRKEQEFNKLFNATRLKTA